MNIDIIEDEIYSFSTVFFQNIADELNENSSFIENNKLSIPKENYTILVDFLNSTLKTFRVLDSKSMSNTLVKLSLDLSLLQGLKTKLDQNMQEVHEIFSSKFLQFSPTLSSIAKDLIELKKAQNKTPEDEEYISRLSADFKDLTAIYYEIFEEIFIEDIESYTEELLHALNSKAYYFDKILWFEADKSVVITKHFQLRKLTNKLNTKDYLLYTTDLMRPYTKEYKYLQSCLRIYK